MATQSKYDYDQVKSFITGEYSEKIDVLAESIRILETDIQACEELFHGKSNGIKKNYAALYNNAGECNNAVTAADMKGRGLWSTLNKAVVLGNIIHAEAVEDEEIDNADQAANAAAADSNLSNF